MLFEVQMPSWDQFKYNNEYQDLIQAYHECNKQYYDFTKPFEEKLKDGKHLTKTEIITLTGLAPKIKNRQLREQLYTTLIEELVLMVSSD